MYSPSGAVGTSPLLLPALGPPAAIILGIGYSCVGLFAGGRRCCHCLHGIACAGIGVVLSQAVRIGECRCEWIAALVGVIVGLVGLYSVWATFTYTLDLE